MTTRFSTNAIGQSSLLLVIPTLLFFPSLLDLVPVWLTFDQNIAHGLFAALMFVFLLVKRPAEQTKLAPTSLLAVLGFFTFYVAWFVVSVANIDTLVYVLLPAVLFMLFAALLGWQTAWAYKAHIFTLLLAMPIWQDLIPYLVLVATFVVTNVVGLLNITAYIQGSNIELPYGVLYIADGCSGVRYFAISLLLANTIAVLNSYRLKGWLVTLAIGAMLGLLINWVRIIALVLIGYYTQMQSSLVADHELFGWVVFAVIALPALYFAPHVAAKSSNLATYAGVRFTKPKIWLLSSTIVLSCFLLVIEQLPTIQKPQFQLQTTTPLVALDSTSDDQFTSQIFNAPTGETIEVRQYQRSKRAEKLVPYVAPIYSDKKWTRLETFVINGSKVDVMMNRVTNKREVYTVGYQLEQRRFNSYRDVKLWQIPASFTLDQRFALLVVKQECRIITCEQTAARITQTLNSLQLQ
ncbi:exosortase/archaeosortase family protein [Salinibius halmophilus]|uniref:exosortase/archaeosortase family protein n=1 Tax=Salinibius halmophilus TaxID=1853216 RepID=UPI000E669C11|nr:exosortase/archaeosortase family protein [Salinibius halmophilus]